MRLSVTMQDGCDFLVARRAFDPCEAAALFCTLYRRTQSGLFGDSMPLAPVFVCDPWPWEEAVPTRHFVEMEDEPALFEAHGGLDEEDVMVVIPQCMCVRPTDPAAMVSFVAMDAASWESDNAPTLLAHEADGRLHGWAFDEFKRAALAARFVRVAEDRGMIDPASACAAYDEICSGAFMALVAARPARLNGELLLARENPGLVRAVHHLVSSARSAPSPLRALDVSAMAEGAFALAMDACPPRMRMSPAA